MDVEHVLDLPHISIVTIFLFEAPDRKIDVSIFSLVKQTFRLRFRLLTHFNNKLETVPSWFKSICPNEDRLE